MELLFWMGVIGMCCLAAAGGVEWILSRPNRKWLRRLHGIEVARAAWRNKLEDA